MITEKIARRTVLTTAVLAIGMAPLATTTAPSITAGGPPGYVEPVPAPPPPAAALAGTNPTPPY